MKQPDSQDPEEVDIDLNDLDIGWQRATDLTEQLEQYLLSSSADVDDDAFFTKDDGTQTIVTKYDLEKTVPREKKPYLDEIERYWVNKPYAFVSILHSRQENEKKYYLVEPHLNEFEDDVIDFLTEKLRTSIRYSEEASSYEEEDKRREVIEEETRKLLDRYDFYTGESSESVLDTVKEATGLKEGSSQSRGLSGSAVRPDKAVIEEDPDYLTQYQVEKLLYYLKRDFVGYERIDGITHDINVEDVSCDGYNSPVFVYHSEYEQLISNVYHGEEQLDDFVIKLAQRSGKSISKRNPQVDATLPNGSRAQLTLGEEVSDHGTNYTLRQFKEVPFTPIDLVNWNTFSLNQMAFLWLAIENNRSLMFAGGTASGKTTSLNAVSLFIPSNSKIVSIEDTREVELPQRNWIASVTRPSFTDDESGAVDEFDLLEAALRQRPEYIVMGEIRGEEGRTLFQVMSTGHTTYTTFHADSVGEVLKRFTTDPINVSKTLFTALDLVSIQTQTRVDGNKVRRSKVITEINRYDTENDEINVQDIYEWNAEKDEFEGFESNQAYEAIETLKDIKFDRGWDTETLKEELKKRRLILAYLIKNNLNKYTEVAATVQAFINDPETILTLVANGELEDHLDNLRQMESVLIDVDPAKEEAAPRPEPTEETLSEAETALEECDDILSEYSGQTAGALADSLPEPSDIAGEEIPAEPDEELPELPELVEEDDDEDVDDEFVYADETDDFIGDDFEEGEDDEGMNRSSAVADDEEDDNSGV